MASSSTPRPQPSSRGHGVTQADMKKKHPWSSFDRDLPSYWFRLMSLDVEPSSLKTERDKDDYIHDSDILLDMISSSDPVEREEALTIPTDATIQTWRRAVPVEMLASVPASSDWAIWKAKDTTAFRVVCMLRKMRPSRIHLALPYLDILGSNPYHNGNNDPLPMMLRGVAMSKPVPENEGKEDEARRLMVDGLNAVAQSVGNDDHNMMYGWGNLARLLRRTNRKNAAEKIDKKFLDWLKHHPCQYTPSRIKYEISQDDFHPTPENPNPPPERMLNHHIFTSWAAECREIPNPSTPDMLYVREMFYQGMHIRTDQQPHEVLQNQDQFVGTPPMQVPRGGRGGRGGGGGGRGGHWSGWRQYDHPVMYIN